MSLPKPQSPPKELLTKPLPDRRARISGRKSTPTRTQNPLPTAVLSQSLPDHTQLPCEDGTFVKNFQEHPQSILLTDSITPVLQRLHPDGMYAIGQDSGIYWDPSRAHDKHPERWAKAPDWCYIPNVPPLLDGEFRGSYVFWKEQVVPTIVIEFVSGNGREERDKTPRTGKFWVYEQGIGVPYYAIFEAKKKRVEVYHLINGRYQKMTPNRYGHYEIAPMDVALGVWRGQYHNAYAWWLRWWDMSGTVLPTSEEQTIAERQARKRERQEAEQRIEHERQEKERAFIILDTERQEAEQRIERERQEAEQRIERERQEAEQRIERERQEKERALLQAERLVAKLRAMGVDLHELDN